MSPRSIKLMRDIRASRGRLLTALMAQAAGMAAMVAMLCAFAVLTREMPRAYLGTNPASAVLEMAAGVDDELLLQLQGRPRIAAADAAATVTARAEVSPGLWLPVRFFVVRDFGALRIGSLHGEAGAYPPPDGTVLIERSALPLARTAVGALLAVEFQHTGRHMMTIAGAVHDAGLAPAWQEGVIYAYVTPRTLARIGETVPLTLLKLLVNDSRGDSGAIERAVATLASWLDGRGHTVLQARIPPPGMHPHQAQMSAVLMLLLAFSAMAMLLAAILTATIIGGLLAQQARQIAIMKAIGARSGQIAALYLGLVGALSALAMMAGVPLGLAAGHALIAAMARLLNLRIQSLSLPWWLYVLVLLAGVVMPLATTLIPILTAARQTVRMGMAGQELRRPASGGGRFSLPRRLARLRLPALPRSPALTVALRNLARRRGRLVMTISLLAGAGAMFVTSLNLRSAWEETVTEAAADRRFDLELHLRQAVPLREIAAAASAVAPGSRIESWPAAPAAIAGNAGYEVVHSYADGAHGGFTLRAAPPDTGLFAHAMLEGRWLAAQDEQGAVLNARARATIFPSVRVGDYITLSVARRPLRLRVAGIVRESLAPAAVYVTPDAFARSWPGAPADGLSDVVRIALADARLSDSAASVIVAALERRHIGVRQVITAKSFAAAQGGHVYILVYALGFIASMMAVVGLLGLASSLGMAVIERRREFGVMRAIGARSAMVIGSVLYEGVLTGLLGSVAGVLLSLPPSAMLAGVLASISAQELSPRLSVSGAAAWLALMIAGSAAVSWLPARRATRWTVKQTMV